MITQVFVDGPITVVEVLLPPGPAGTGGGDTPTSEINITAISDGAQTIPLPGVTIGLREFFINGLRQRTVVATVVGNAATLPASLQIMTDDIITLVYA
jgi:hypothetical protein